MLGSLYAFAMVPFRSLLRFLLRLVCVFGSLYVCILVCCSLYVFDFVWGLLTSLMGFPLRLCLFLRFPLHLFLGSLYVFVWVPFTFLLGVPLTSLSLFEVPFTFCRGCLYVFVWGCLYVFVFVCSSLYVFYGVHFTFDVISRERITLLKCVMHIETKWFINCLQNEMSTADFL